MRVKVLGSGSGGNCYLLQGKNETLIIECGINYREILKGLDFNLTNIIGCLVSHEHKDHSKAVKDLITKGIDVYMSNGTKEACGADGYRIRTLKSEEVIKIGEFIVLPFKVEHDAVEPLGFLINHKEMGSMLFLTDTYYCQYKFVGLNHVFIECNYSEEILNKNIELGLLTHELKDRLLKSHFDVNNAKDFLLKHDLSNVKEIVLLHLSDGNSNQDDFKNKIEGATGKPVYIASEGLEVDLEG